MPIFLLEFFAGRFLNELNKYLGKFLNNKFSTKQILNLNLGPFGVSVAFAVIYANLNGVFILLGAKPEQLSMLWFLPAVISFLVPPLFGHISDRTNSSWGKRLPYIFFGTIGTAISMALVPTSPSLFWAGLVFCLFIFFINVAMQYRALIVDIVPAQLHTKLYALQTAISGIGAILATAMPWFFSKLFRYAVIGRISFSVAFAFYVSAAALIFVAIWTVVSCKRYVPQTKKNTDQEEARQKGILRIFYNMPNAMWLISFIQFTIWIAVGCFIIYFTPVIQQTIFRGVSSQLSIEKSIVLTGLASSAYLAANILFAYCIPVLAKVIKRKNILMFSLFAGGAGLISLQFAHHFYFVLIAMIGFGITWAGFNSVPYAIVASVVPTEKVGLYMGVFNMAVCLPQILISILGGIALKHIFANNAPLMMAAGGFCLIIAGFLTLLLRDVG